MIQWSSKILGPNGGGVVLQAAARISWFANVFAVISPPFTTRICDLTEYKKKLESRGEIA